MCQLSIKNLQAETCKVGLLPKLFLQKKRENVQIFVNGSCDKNTFQLVQACRQIDGQTDKKNLLDGKIHIPTNISCQFQALQKI